MRGTTTASRSTGWKAAVLRWVEARDLASEIESRRKLQNPGIEDWLRATPPATLGLLASFQKTVIEELLRRANVAVEQTGAKSLIIGGGVACNTGLRAAARNANLPCPVYFPTPGLSTDNAAMIAAAAFPKFRAGRSDDFSLRAQANLALA